MRISRRKFLALCGAAAVSPALPASLRGLETPPVDVKNLVHQAIGKDSFAALPPAMMPEVGDMLILRRDGVYQYSQNGVMHKLSREIKVEPIYRHYWKAQKYSGVENGISRSRK